jgi:DNA-binding NarL/FixJ family response regulator
VSRDIEDGTVLLELVGELVGLLDLDELRTGLLRALLRAVPAKWASLNEVGPDGVVALVEPELDERWFGPFAQLAHENPLYQHWVRTRDGRAYRFSDVTTREALEATRLYREVYAPLGVNHQIALSLPSQRDRILALVLSREDRDFSDAERDLLNQARPFMIQVYRNAVAFSALRSVSSAGLLPTLASRGLTTREAEVVSQVALGGSNRDIATALQVSDRTVQKHLEHAFRKLGVSTRSEAAAKAWELAREDGEETLR